MEYIVVNSAIAYPQYLSEFLESIPLRYFKPQSQKILEIVLKKQESGEAVTMQSLMVELGSEFSNSEYFKNVLSAQLVPLWLELKESFKTHLLLQRQEQVAHKLLEASSKAEVLDLSIVESEVEIQRGEIRTLGEWMEYYKSLPLSPKIACGIDFLDKCFDSGFELGQLVLIMGDPEAGKTALAVQMLEYMARKHKVCFFCFEFTIENYLAMHRVKQLDNMYLFNDGYDISEVCQNIKLLYKKGVKIFLIDSQMRLSSSIGSNMEEKESAKFSALARLCHSLKILVFLVVQNSKEDRENPMGSKKGGHEASITIRIERVPASKEMQKIAEWDENSRFVLVKKNKQTGKHFKDKVLFDTQTRHFSNPEFSKPKDELKKLDMAEIEAIIKNLA